MKWLSNIIKSSQIRIIDTPIIKHKEQETKETKETELREKIIEVETIAKGIIDDAKKEAEDIILVAKKEAEKVLEETHSNVKNIYDTAREDGYSKGLEEGYAEGKKTSDILIEEANEIKKNYMKEKEIVLSNIEKEVIDLIISICEKILNQKLENDKEVIIPIILKGINSLNVKENLLIKVSKEDFNIVDMSKQRLLAMANLVEDIQIRVDSTLSKGGCIIEGSKGNVEASIDLQIEEMRKILTTLLNGE